VILRTKEARKKVVFHQDCDKNMVFSSEKKNIKTMPISSI
jgi:hypothetical protein